MEYKATITLTKEIEVEADSVDEAHDIIMRNELDCPEGYDFEVDIYENGELVSCNYSI